MKVLSKHSIKGSSEKIVQLAIPETEIDFEKYYKLRYEVLRKPWNKPEGTERDDGDNTSHHACLLDGDEVIGVCRLQINSVYEAQIRYMAVHEKYRGENLGSLMLSYFETVAKEQGIKTMILQAREVAVNFYKRNGYETLEKTFLLFDEIQHYLMKKAIR